MKPAVSRPAAVSPQAAVSRPAGVSRPASAPRTHLKAAVAAVLVSVLLTWPLAAQSWDHILKAMYHWDAYTNTMILGGRVDALLGRGPLSLYESYYFAPLSRTIVFNENHFGLSLIFLPFYLISQNPLWAYNMTLLSALSLSVFFSYLLVRRLTKSGYAGFLAGVSFAFCPYVMFELGRIQLVATMFIPAAFLFLHRAIEGQKTRDLVAFWLSVVLQIGTCLYYAMFLIPLLGVVAGFLLHTHRPARRFYVTFALGGVVAGALALLMVYPYFAARHAFDLERSLSFASSYDGELSFFSNVHTNNRTLTALHHVAPSRGAHEEIAFPGFVPLGLCLLALVRWLHVTVLPRPPGRWLRDLGSFCVLLALSVAATLITRSMLVGLLLGIAGGFEPRLQKRPRVFSSAQLYVVVLLVAVLMFLGLEPLRVDDQPVRGLYYYFHTYFPGFNGIRKVSRQAVMTSFVLVVLASFGSSWLLSQLRGHKRRLAFAGLLLAILFELRSFPHPVQKAWAGSAVPAVYEFLAQLPRDDVLAVLPQNEGKRRFVGDDGMAHHNYLSLYHKHHFANGQSSWMPQVTELVRRAQLALPNPDAARLLRLVGVQHLLVHASDLPFERAELPLRLMADPAHFRSIFQQDGDHVFSLLGPRLSLLDTPALPPEARLIPSPSLMPRAELQAHRTRWAVDGQRASHWSTRRAQRRGDAFELKLDRPRALLALEIHNPNHEMFLPLSFTLSAKDDHGVWHTVAEQPQVQLYREQVHAPKTFVFRIVLPHPTTTDQLRLAVGTPLPGYDFVIHEIQLYEAAP